MPGIYDWLFGKKEAKDIDLPMEPGDRRDPRLGKKRANPADVLEGLRKAAEGYKSLREKKIIGKRDE